MTHFQWDDPFFFASMLNDEERLVQKTANDFAQGELMPRILHQNRDETFDPSVLKAMGDIGFLGMNVPQKGQPKPSYISYGLVARELERVDSSYRSSFSVQSSLVMYPIAQFGSDEQQAKYLPTLASGTAIGCFGLTEPEAGSDPGSMRTRAKRVGGDWCLNGSKQWITHSPIADVFIIWAKDESGTLQGFILDKGTKGLSAPLIDGKFSLRASVTGGIILEDVIVSDAQRLPHTAGFRSVFQCLNHARYGIAWGALGAGEFCWHAARSYTMERQQFGRPLAATQIVQKKLVEMQVELNLALLGVLQAGRLLDEGRCPPELISLLKRNSCGKALAVAREARDMHGANGITDDYHVIRHMLNLEAVNTYEGTHDVHALILGKAQTGLNAFGT